MRKIKVDKCEIVKDSKNSVFIVLGDKDLTGDELILSLANEIERLNEELERKTFLLHIIDETVGQNTLQANEKVNVINLYLNIAKDDRLLDVDK